MEKSVEKFRDEIFLMRNRKPCRTLGELLDEGNRT